MSKIKAGHLYLLVRCTNPAMMQHNGTIRTAASPSRVHFGAWYLDPPVIGSDGVRGSWLEDDLIPIRDQPGNEEFVTKLRDKLPRSKPATTKGDTINERGELQS